MPRIKTAEAVTNIKIRRTTLHALNGKKRELNVSRKRRRPFSQSDVIDMLILRADMEPRQP